MSYVPTPEATAIFTEIELGTGNIVIEAVAGAGKTTNIIEALNYIDEDLKILMCSFTTEAAKQLGDKIKAQDFKNVSSSTLNAAGWGTCWLGQGRKPELDGNKTTGILGNYFPTRFKDADQMAVYNTIKGPLKRLVGLGKGLVLRPDQFVKHLLTIVTKYSVDLPDPGKSDFESKCYKAIFDLAPKVYEDSIEMQHIMDFDDQKFMPVYHNYPTPKFKFIFVDEAQDCNRCDLMLVEKLLAPGGRVVFVGDRFQAIYMFRGSMSDAMDVIVKTFNAKVMPLTVCWRCPDSVIERAQTIVPHIQAPTPNPNGAGIVKTLKSEEFYETVQPGDYCIARTTVVVVGACLRLLSKGVRASVLGKEVGGTLKELIGTVLRENKMPKDVDLAEFVAALKTYRDENVLRLQKQEKDDIADMVSDRCETLELFCQECPTLDAVAQKIDSLFVKSETPGVTLMTGHKCKGLQNRRVFFLRPDLCPSPRAKTEEAYQQEMNLLYVITTRAQSELYYVAKDSKDGKDQATEA